MSKNKQNHYKCYMNIMDFMIKTVTFCLPGQYSSIMITQ